MNWFTSAASMEANNIYAVCYSPLTTSVGTFTSLPDCLVFFVATKFSDVEFRLVFEFSTVFAAM